MPTETAQVIYDNLHDGMFKVGNVADTVSIWTFSSISHNYSLVFYPNKLRQGQYNFIRKPVSKPTINLLSPNYQILFF